MPRLCAVSHIVRIEMLFETPKVTDMLIVRGKSENCTMYQDVFSVFSNISYISEIL